MTPIEDLVSRLEHLFPPESIKQETHQIVVVLTLAWLLETAGAPRSVAYAKNVATDYPDLVKGITFESNTVAKKIQITYSLFVPAGEKVDEVLKDHFPEDYGSED